MEQSPIVTPVDLNQTQDKTGKTSKPVLLILITFLIILGGIGTGYILSGKNQSNSQTNVSVTAGENAISSENVFGSTDLETFKDAATGKLEKGGLNGEGTHQLVREGGPDQTVYLVSSTVDLDEFVGKKVEIHGQTMRARRVGWLMDVGQVKILE